MWRVAGYAAASVGLAITIAAVAFRKVSFIIVNGYYVQTWWIWMLGVLLLSIGVVVVWRAA
jgi:hypothetical protein